MSRPPGRGVPKWMIGGLVLGLALIVAGIALSKKENPGPLDPRLGIADSAATRQLGLRQQVDHPVNESQQKAANSLDSEKAPFFSLKGTDGRTYTLAELNRDKPLLIFFVEKECPCCLGAKYFVDKMADAYGEGLNTIGIINADGETAQTWVRATKPKFLVLQDPKQIVIREYKAERGVYTTLIAPGGTIDKAYPGYGKEMLQDLGKRIARLAKLPEKKFTHAAAPDTMTSGCIFPDPNESTTP
jgi:peroxiredoxin